MRDAVYLFVWLIAIVLMLVFFWLVAWRVYEEVFVPLPYHDPEPPITSTAGLVSAVGLRPRSR